MTQMLRKLALVLAVVVLLGAACGDDGDDVGTESPDQDAPVSLPGTVNQRGTVDVTGDDEVEMELNDFYFDPTFLKVEAGQELTVKLHNAGETAHTFTTNGVDEELAPGDRTSVTVTAPSSGATMFTCRFHEAQGMKGAFYLQEGDEVSPAGGAGGAGGSGTTTSSTSTTSTTSTTTTTTTTGGGVGY